MLLTGKCRGCAARGLLTKHHVFPKALRHRCSKANRKKLPVDYCIILCSVCHKRLHQHFGKGNAWKGPLDGEEQIQWLRMTSRTSAR